MLKHGFFPFHIVDCSPWPVMTSLSLFNMVSLCVVLMTSSNKLSLLQISLALMFFVNCLYGWMRDMTSEALFLGEHSVKVQKGLKMGMVLFILSEVMFFLSFFWSLLFYSLSPSVELGGWPPAGISTIDPMGVPLLGTLILISSGVTVTWAHHAIMESKSKSFLYSMSLTLFLGIGFTFLQISEYLEVSFSINDSVFGSIFFLSTGFHGIHVLIGTLMLSVCLFRSVKFHYSKTHHVSLEASIWYWHFVDVVWLFLYVLAYWWGWMEF